MNWWTWWIGEVGVHQDAGRSERVSLQQKKTMQPSWLDTAEYPFAPHYFSINGHQLQYIDEGKGDTLLFVHGTPSWSFDFRNVIKALSPNFRCIAVDHIGFGLSDKPEHYDYSTANHNKTLAAFVEGKTIGQHHLSGA